MKDFDITHWRNEDHFLDNIQSKKRSLRISVFVCTLVMLPLTIKNFIHADFYLGLLTLTCITLIWLELISVHLRGTTFFHFSVQLGLLIASAVSPIYQIGLYGVIWIFPLITVFFFFTPFKVACLSSLALIASATTLSVIKFEPELYIRLFFSWSICALICAGIRSDINRLQNSLREQSSKDPLTGALNRRQLDICLQNSIRQNEHFGTAASIALIDIDNFKAINDNYGHDVGDRLIQEVVATLEQHSRKEDLLFRIGGDEMLLLFQNITEQQALVLCEKLRRLITEHTNQAIGSAKLSVSIGLSRYHSTMNQDIWFKRADQALYQAKSAGRNQVVLSEPDNFGDLAVGT